MKPSPMPARLLALVPSFVVLAALLAGCSSGPPVLAKIGDRRITVDDFLDAASRSQEQYAGSPDSAKAALLEDLVKRELVVSAAIQRGLVSPADQARMLQQAQEQLALRALIRQLAPRDVPVSDAEVQALYQKRAIETHTLIVFTPDRAACEQAFGEIQRGADFKATADRFNTTGMVPPGGDLGFITPGTLMPVLDDALTNGVPGKVLGPIESPTDGWFLVKVVERRPRPQEPFEQAREMLRQGLQQGKQRVLLNRVQRDLATQYHVTVEAGASQALFARYNSPKDTMAVGGSPVPVPAPPTPEEARQVLVRYDGADGKPGTGTYTLGDMMLDLQDASKPRPSWSVLPMIDQWLKNAVLQRVALIEARRRRLGEEPALARQARTQMENVLLQTAYEALVLNSAKIGDDDVQAAYLRHAAQLLGKDGVPIEYAKLDPNIQKALQNEALEFARERRLKELTDALALQLKPVVYQDRLKRIPWPVPQAEPGK
jgi:parvulin-like peptidyl-prolyl isomerase